MSEQVLEEEESSFMVKVDVERLKKQ